MISRPIYDIYRECGYWGTVVMLLIWLIAGEYWEGKP